MKNKILKVKIANVSDKHCWYKDLIGSEFEVQSATMFEYILAEDNEKLMKYKLKNPAPIFTSITAKEYVDYLKSDEFFESLRFILKKDCSVFGDEK